MPNQPTQSAHEVEPDAWEVGGTAYDVTPLPEVRSPVSAQESLQAERTLDDALLPGISGLPAPASRLLEPTPRPALNWALIGGIALGTLLTAVVITQWRPWAIDSTVSGPLDHDAGTSTSLTDAESHHEATVAATLEPSDSGHLFIPPSEPVPEDSPPVHPEPEWSASPPSPASEADGQIQPAQPSPLAQVPSASLAPVPPDTSAPGQSESAPPASGEQKARPAPLPAMTITAAKPARVTRPQHPDSAHPQAKVGTLIVAIKPWGEVWIDGQKHGISPPLLKLQLRPGTYLIELRNPGLPSVSQRLQISAGQATTLQHSFQ
ncbi:hypothetical protein [Pseudomonas sp. SCB32]|uniref:hypothetical protein n=1 Tax=Pseudomonas sp. SCB32 TaxID=2653853 RepID=UPI00126592F3|nr:hypothetical protein [Pseudomonas sp. SCB32]